MSTTQTFAITGMHCASCSMLIDEVLEDLEGVTRSDTSLRKGQSRVQFDPVACSPSMIVDAIAEAGYAAVAVG